MKKVTKKEVRERNAAWRLALVEGRVVNFPAFGHLKSYPTVEAARAALADAVAAEVPAFIVELVEG